MFVIIAVLIADLATDAVDIPWWLYAVMVVAYALSSATDLD